MIQVLVVEIVNCNTVKPPISKRQLGFKTNYCLMQVKSIAEHAVILLTFIKASISLGCEQFATISRLI